MTHLKPAHGAFHPKGGPVSASALTAWRGEDPPGGLEGECLWALGSSGMQGSARLSSVFANYFSLEGGGGTYQHFII